MSVRRFFSGNTIEQAVMKAASHFNLSPDDLDYKPVEKKTGFLRVQRSVVIEVDPENPGRAVSDEEARRKAQSLTPEAQSAEPTEVAPVAPPKERAPKRADKGAPRKAEKKMVDLPERPQAAAEKYPEAEGDVADAARESLEELLELAGAQMESSILQGGERLEIELWGPDQDRLLRDNGRPLLSIQHLLPRMIRGKTGEAVFCRVDCDRFHDIREERIRDLAQRVASDVTSRGRSRLLESMAPDERRIVHMTLADDPNVVTESQGDGFFKRIKVRPA